MTDTPNLALPYILAAQAQKHVTHNEAIRALDCIVQLSVESRDLTSPPASPSEGSRYVVASDAGGAWAGQSNKIAAFQDGAWAFYAPKEGWTAWVRNENILIVYAASGWASMPGGGDGGGGGVTDHGMLTGLADDDHLQYLTNARGDARYTPIDPATLGVNAMADTTNRLAVSGAASLFNHDGSGHQIKVNKNAAADTASLLFQNGFSGRAEMGLAGDDDFHFKVSPDGSAWFDSIRIDRATGKVSFPAMGASREVLAADRTYYVRTDGDDDNDGLLNTAGRAFLTLQKAIDVVAALDLSIYNVTIQVGDGTYTGSVSLNAPWVGAGVVTLRGNTTTPGNCIISVTGADAVYAKNNAALIIDGFEIRTATSGDCIRCDTGASIVIGAHMRFGACAARHLDARLGGVINASSYSVVGGAFSHLSASEGGSVRIISGTVTVTGTPAFTEFVEAASGIVTSFATTFSGAATGKRYVATLNAVINTFAGGANLFPGNAEGTTATGAQYS